MNKTNLDRLTVYPFDLTDDEMEEFARETSGEFPKVNSLGQRLFDANGNAEISTEDRKEMITHLGQKFGEIFDILRIDRNDPNSTHTPSRLAKMWVNELFAGRFGPPPKMTAFPNRKKVDELVISSGIPVMSLCSHHWQTISGTCAIGYLPGKYVIGLSKLTRIVDWYSRRGQIQEELGEQIADFLISILQPKALGVVIKAKHYCMIARGVRSPESQSEMVTSVMRGQLGTDLNLRMEFLKLIER